MALVCCECGRESDGAARGWRAYHAIDQFSHEDEVVTFCPACAERDFGPRRIRPLPQPGELPDEQ
jgi:hypothetical protein